MKIHSVHSQRAGKSLLRLGQFLFALLIIRYLLFWHSNNLGIENWLHVTRGFFSTSLFVIYCTATISLGTGMCLLAYHKSNRQRTIVSTVLWTAMLLAGGSVLWYQNLQQGSNNIQSTEDLQMQLALQHIEESQQLPRSCEFTDALQIPAPNPQKSSVQSVTDLLASDFCTLLQCEIFNEWHLDTKEANTMEYLLQTNLGHKAADRISISTKDDAITHLNLSFYGREHSNRLCDGDKRLVRHLMHIFHPQGDLEPLATTITNHMQIRAYWRQYDKEQYTWGSYTVRGGFEESDGPTVALDREL